MFPPSIGVMLIAARRAAIMKVVTRAGLQHDVLVRLRLVDVFPIRIASGRDEFLATLTGNATISAVELDPHLDSLLMFLL